MVRALLARGTALAVLVLIHSTPLAAQDMLKISVGGRGAFDNQVSEVGERQGFFKTHGLALDVRYSRDGGETMQAVLAGAVDVGVSVGTLPALGLYAKGAPIRVLGSSMVGAHEFWYVPVNAPIKSLREAAGRKVAYSATGAASNLMVLGFEELYGVKFQPVATGDPAATLARVMSRQVDVGYSVPPVAVAELEQGRIRVIGRGNDLPGLARQTVRFIVANADALEQRPQLFRRYLQGYRGTVEWMFSADPRATAAYAEWAGVSEAVARRSRDELMSKQSMLPDEISGLEAIMADAVTFRFVGAPLGAEAIKTLIRRQPPIN